MALWIVILAYIASWAAATKIITGWARDNQPVLLAHDALGDKFDYDALMRGEG